MNTNTNIPGIISDLADSVGGTITECVNDLGDGSGFATMSMALPEDHWIYETTPDGFTPRSTYPMMAGKDSKARDFLSRIIVNHGGKYGVKAATSNGREDDFDPDALVRNIEIGLFGLFTADGLTGDPEDSKLFDPIQPGNLGKVLLEAVALAMLDGIVKLEDVVVAVQPDSLAAYEAAHHEREAQRARDYEALCIRKGWDKMEGDAADTAVSEDQSKDET